MVGFDYRSDSERDLPVTAWRDESTKLLREGGFRRVESGETFVHDKTGHIAFEVYGYVPAPKGGR